MSVEPLIKPWHSLIFGVYGDPIPQGSMRSLGPKRMIASNYEALMQWRESVRQAAIVAMAGNGPMPPGIPVVARLKFRVKRPTSAPKRVEFPARRPDLDKYIRAVFDALTLSCVADDAQIVAVYASKEFAGSYHMPGVAIRLSLPERSVNGR